MNNDPDQDVVMPLLFPLPRRMQIGGGMVMMSPAARREIQAFAAGDETRKITAHPDADLSRGGYRIEVNSKATHGVHITVADIHGFWAARETIKQLLDQYAENWPQMEIEDWPAFATRGIMLDVSRCRIPTMREFHDIIDLLASLKFNHLQLYTEHTFAYAGHEDAWRGWSPLTADEIGRLGAYAADRGMELVANQNCFGHLSHWLKMPQYQHLAETHGDWVFDVWPRSGPFSLCPTDDNSLKFVRDLLEQLLPCFQSSLVNIGCDETYDVGWGRSKAAVEARGRHAVYAEFVAKVSAVVNQLGKRPAFWADIALHDASALDVLPKDLIALCWGYEPDSQFGEWVRTCRARGLEAWVCPGTSSWCSITGRASEAATNIQRGAMEGLNAGATGFLMTDWGDRGHHQTWPVALLGIARGAQAAWNPDRLHDPHLQHALSRHAYGKTSGDVAALVHAIGEIDAPIRQIAGKLTRPNDPQPAPRLLNQSALFADLWKPWNTGAEIARLNMWHEAAERLHDCRVKLAHTAASPLVRDELAHTLDCATLALTRAILRRKETATSAEIAALTPQLHHIMREHARLWAIRSRSGGLEQSLQFYRTIGKTLVPQ
jgi:hexosaminidase